MRKLSTIDRADATLAVSAIREALIAENRAAVIAVADVHGDLIALERLDTAPSTSVTIATNKAWTSATQGVPTSSIGARLRNTDEAFDIAYYGDARACGWGGGLPVRDREGTVIGAVAVSGLPEREDERFAEIGRQAIESR